MPGDAAELLPFYKQLAPAQQHRLETVSGRRRYEPGQMLYTGPEHCLGLLVVIRGQLRVFTQSEEGREITLYRLFERDMCLFSASCILRGVSFSLRIEAQEVTEVLHIPSDEYQRLMQENPAAANYTNEVMATRFSDVMWLLEQTLYKRWMHGWRPFWSKRAGCSTALSSRSPTTRSPDIWAARGRSSPACSNISRTRGL